MLLEGSYGARMSDTELGTALATHLTPQLVIRSWMMCDSGSSLPSYGSGQKGGECGGPGCCVSEADCGGPPPDVNSLTPEVGDF